MAANTSPMVDNKPFQIYTPIHLRKVVDVGPEAYVPPHLRKSASTTKGASAPNPPTKELRPTNAPDFTPTGKKVRETFPKPASEEVTEEEEVSGTIVDVFEAFCAKKKQAGKGMSASKWAKA
ncbi:hypothetical protein EJ04DRAFT_570804 [Polyplosphaeria fusca]|uniref:Uncharacterized protein n=1 Tax=Polyplosphaeria fusca TaxID=682080 RepID=A0A9P4UWA6_9PLEO|nr:hypothetical protein EJ04DRAFT_570804 [Polyplosphaeria fusca]